VAPHIRARSAFTHGPDPDVDPIVSRSLLALAVGLALILAGILLDRITEV